jgi:hypothetical protein
MKHEEFSENDTFDFVRCQRPNGTYYGTSGTCRKGAQVGAKEKAALKKAAAAGNQKAKVALAVVEGKMTKAQAKKKIGKTNSAKSETKPKTKTETTASVEEREKLMADLKSKKAAYFKAVKAGQWEKASKLNQQIIEAREKVDAAASPAEKEAKAKYKAKIAAEEKAMRDAAKEARKRAAPKPPKVEISEAARAAIVDYTKDEPGPPAEFTKMNKVARTGKGSVGIKAKNEALDRALTELPSNTQGKSHFRGMSNISPSLAKQMAGLKPGDTLTDRGFGSYSRNLNVANAFVKGAKNRVMIESRSSSLRAAEQFSKIKGEQEAILPRGTLQTVREVRREGDLTYIVVD